MIAMVAMAGREIPLDRLAVANDYRRTCSCGAVLVAASAFDGQSIRLACPRECVLARVERYQF